jgi:hypothetical protein
MNCSALQTHHPRSLPSRPTFAWFVILIAWLVLDLVGLRWGLPAKWSDKYLFGSSTPWLGREIVQLLPSQALGGNRSADVASHAPLDRSRAIILNATDFQRAQIIERYRLYTAQPDEMITLRALGGMRPSQHDLDPRLYQYGGDWVYPIGALIRVLCQPKPDVTWYLDHPEAIGRFYLIMRAVSAIAGLIAALVIWHLMRRCLPSHPFAAVLAAILFLAMPAAVNAAHEGKPHLAGTALALLAIDTAAAAIVARSLPKLLAAGACCGLAVGTVLTAAPVMFILPIAAWRWRGLMRDRIAALALSATAAIAAYGLTNPYVLAHLFGDRTLLTANLSNTTAMYSTASQLAGVANAAWLIAEGTGRWVAFVGLIGALVAVITRMRRKSSSSAAPAPGALDAFDAGQEVSWLLFTVALAAAIPFIALAANKPAEFGRFALLPDAALALSAAWLLGRGLPASPSDRWIAPIRVSVLLVAQLIAGGSYVIAFEADALGRGTRPAGADVLASLQRQGASHLVVFAEPAPYCLPPVNLFDWTIELAPLAANDSYVTTGIGVRAVDRGIDSTLTHRWLDLFVDPSHPLAWADKPLLIFGPHPATPVHSPGATTNIR